MDAPNDLSCRCGSKNLKGEFLDENRTSGRLECLDCGHTIEVVEVEPGKKWQSRSYERNAAAGRA